MNERVQHSEYTKVSNDFLNYHSMSDLLPYESYDEAYEVFINERSYGFILEVGVFTGFSEELERELSGLFQSILPEGSSIQFLLVASQKIGNILQNWEQARKIESNSEINWNKYQSIKSQIIDSTSLRKINDKALIYGEN
jgi:hypothetical protein